MQDFKRIKDLLKPNVIKPQGFEGPEDPVPEEFTPEMDKAQQDASLNYADLSAQRRQEEKLKEVLKPADEEQMPGLTPEEEAMMREMIKRQMR